MAKEGSALKHPVNRRILDNFAAPRATHDWMKGKFSCPHMHGEKSRVSIQSGKSCYLLAMKGHSEWPIVLYLPLTLPGVLTNDQNLLCFCFPAGCLHLHIDYFSARALMSLHDQFPDIPLKSLLTIATNMAFAKVKSKKFKCVRCGGSWIHADNIWGSLLRGQWAACFTNAGGFPLAKPHCHDMKVSVSKRNHCFHLRGFPLSLVATNLLGGVDVHVQT